MNPSRRSRSLVLKFGIPVGLFFAVQPAAQARPENWYFLPLSIGWSHSSYPRSTQSQIASFPTSTSNFALAGDVLGFYWPIGKNTILGGVSNFVSDSFTDPSGELSILHGHVGVSLMSFFFGREVGQGWFVRADAGGSYVDESLKTPLTTIQVTSHVGFGALVGGGYGFMISDESRALINVDYALRSVPGDYYRVIMITAGLLL